MSSHDSERPHSNILQTEPLFGGNNADIGVHRSMVQGKSKCFLPFVFYRKSSPSDTFTKLHLNKFFNLFFNTYSGGVFVCATTLL